MKKIYFIVLIFAVTAILGCSGGGDNPTAPSEQAAQSTASHHQTWGMWQFIADPEEGTLQVVQLRTGEFHLNALPFLEPPPGVNLTLESVKFNGNVVEADIGLRHPFLGLTEFTGFDVCGILITNGSVTGFDDPELRMAGDGDTRLLNPDGLSRWWNPAEFPVNLGTMFSYNDGLLGTADAVGHYNSTLNAYKYFCDELEPTDPITDVSISKRGLFSAGAKNIRHYSIALDAGLIFNYAVDACWQFPVGGSPWQAPEDFPPGANRPEARYIEVAEIENTLWNDGDSSGGDLILAVDVYDWFNAGLNTIKVESAGNFMPLSSTTTIGGGAGYSTYEVDILDATPAADSITLFISVESESIGYDGFLPGKPVTSYFFYTADVGGESPVPQFGWARNWGPSEYTGGKGVAVDNDGNAFASGKFQGTIDFDPGPGIDNHSSQGGYDVYVCKFDYAGEFQWARTWGGADWEYNRGLAVDNDGNVYVPGYYAGTVDFDPGSGTDNHSANGAQDVFITKFNPDGDFLWARTWGGSSSDDGYGAETDEFGNVYITGQYQNNVNFNPSGSENRTSNGGQDVFLSKFDSDGNFIWVRTWGGPNWDYGHDISFDSSGNLYTVGWFAGTVDFDPGAGVDSHTADADPGVYLCKYTPSGDFTWARTWGGSRYQGYDFGIGVNTDDGSNIYVAGRYSGTVDFDPGPGDESHTYMGSAPDDVDAFVSSFDSNGEFRWVATWGSSSVVRARGVDCDAEGNVFVGGDYTGYVDFDPDPIDEEVHSSTNLDVSVSKFDSSGDLLWVRTWGAFGNDRTGMLAVDKYGNAFFTGILQGTANLAPASPPCDESPENHSSSGECDAFLIKLLPDGCW